MRLEFLQKRMRLEKQKLIIALFIQLLIIFMFLVISLINYSGYIFGLKDLKTNEKVNKFYNSNYFLSNIQKNSKLGKQLSKLGDYKKVLNEINTQTKNPIYKSGNVIICENYILLLKHNSTDIIPINNIQNITSIPDKNYPDEIINIQIDCQEQRYCFDVYNNEDEQKIINHIKNIVE